MSEEAIVERLNSVDITHEELQRVVTELAELHEEGTVDGEAGLFLIVRMFSEEPDKATAIHFRLAALAQAIKEQQAPGWTLPTSEDGCTLTNGALIHAAAVCPLVEVNDKIRFDSKTLLAKALELAEPEGNA